MTSCNHAQVAESEEHRMDPNQPYLQQGHVYPPKSQAYPQGQAYPPPPYDYKPKQPVYYTPQTTSPSVVMVSSQPRPVATTTHLSPPRAQQDNSGMAICALVFSIFTLFCCSTSCICLVFSIPALILAIVALTTTGSSQKTNAGISIGLNVAVVVCTVLVLGLFIPSYFALSSVSVSVASSSSTPAPPTTASYLRYCPPYKPEGYNAYCVPYEYYTYSTCRYYVSFTSRWPWSYCPY